MEKQYWRSLEELEGLPERGDEFGDTAPSRRGFLKAAGFAFASAVLTSCSRAPVEKAMPYLAQPEGLVAGRAQFYSSTCDGCSAGCGLLVKVRDGRPIKLEGNPEQAVSRWATCAVGQASILGVYASVRLKRPIAGGKPSSWQEVDVAIRSRLRPDTVVRYLSGTVISPSNQAAI